MSNDQHEGGAKAAGPGDPQTQARLDVRGLGRTQRLVAPKIVADSFDMNPKPSHVVGAPPCPPGYTYHPENETCRFEVGTRPVRRNAGPNPNAPSRMRAEVDLPPFVETKVDVFGQGPQPLRKPNPQAPSRMRAEVAPYANHWGGWYSRTSR